MRSLFFKSLFVLAIWVAGTVCAHAAVDTQQSEPATVVTQQSVDNLPVASQPASASTTTVSHSTVSPSSATVETTSTAKTETLKITADAQPVQVAMVDGDYHKYEAMNWQNRGYSGGVKDLSIHYTSGDDVTIDADGSGIIGNGDYKGDYSIKKKVVGYVDFDFMQFRKYYDTYGGIWQGHSDSLSRDLYLDIGHIGFEAGITMPDLPAVSVYYDHDYKTGSKSMLNWDSTFVNGNSKKIAPAWEEIDETTDTFGVKGEYTEKGYHMTGDQRWEISRWKTQGYEQRLSDGSATGTSVSSQYDQRRQDQAEETNLMTTTLGVDRWYLSDKVYGSSAYRFEHLNNTDRQAIQEFTPLGSLNYQAAGKPFLNNVGGSANNTENLSSWVLNLMVSPWSWLSGTGAFKA